MKRINLIGGIFVFLFLLTITVPFFANAQKDYDPLVINQLPGFENSKNPSEIVGSIYNISIGLGGILAVIMIIWAGMRYTVSEAVGSKEEAIKDIQAAVLGLMLLLGSFIILKTINPNLVEIGTNLQNLPATGGAVTAPTNLVEKIKYCYGIAYGGSYCYATEQECRTWAKGAKEGDGKNVLNYDSKNGCSGVSYYGAPVPTPTEKIEYCYTPTYGDERCFGTLPMCTTAAQKAIDSGENVLDRNTFNGCHEKTTVI